MINPQNHTIQTVGMLFSPDTLNVIVGDTITFNIGDFHNAVEVDSSTYVANGATSNGGFSFGEGNFQWVVPQAQTYYYVCQPMLWYEELLLLATYQWLHRPQLITMTPQPLKMMVVVPILPFVMLQQPTLMMLYILVLL